MNEFNVKGIIFDLDDTLIPSQKIYASVYREMQLEPDTFESARRFVKKSLPENHVASHNRLLYFKEYLQLLDKYSAKKHLELIDQYENRLVSHIKKFWDASSNKTTIELLASKFPCSIASNENLRTQTLKLSIIDPHGDLFKHVLISEELGIEKPLHSFFYELEKRQKIALQHCAMVGDSWQNDLQPALALEFSLAVQQKQFNPEIATFHPEIKPIDNLDALKGLLCS